MKFLTKKLLGASFILLVLGSSSSAYASSIAQGESYKIAQLDLGFTKALEAVGLSKEVDGVVGIRAKILLIISNVLKILAVIAMGAMVYGGFLYVTSLGSEDKAKRGKTIVAYTIIGIIIIGFSAILVNALIVIIS